MTKPPATPPSSDLTGVNRDGPKIAQTKDTPDPKQQQNLKGVSAQDVARPPYDPSIATKGNAQ